MNIRMVTRFCWLTCNHIVSSERRKSTALQVQRVLIFSLGWSLDRVNIIINTKWLIGISGSP